MLIKNEKGKLKTNSGNYKTLKMIFLKNFFTSVLLSISVVFTH